MHWLHTRIAKQNTSTSILLYEYQMLAHKYGGHSFIDNYSNAILSTYKTNKYEVMTTEELFEKFTSNSFTEEELSSLHEKWNNIKGWDVQEEPYRHINPASKDNWLKDCPKKLREELDKLWQLD